MIHLAHGCLQISARYFRDKVIFGISPLDNHIPCKQLQMTRTGLNSFWFVYSTWILHAGAAHTFTQVFDDGKFSDDSTFLVYYPIFTQNTKLTLHAIVDGLACTYSQRGYCQKLHDISICVRPYPKRTTLYFS